MGQAAATASTLTVTDSSTPTITATNDIRIRIPAALNMVWDTSVTSVTLSGGAAGKVSATGVTYEDSNKTAVLNVTSNFAASDVVTIAGLKFTSFTAASSATSLQLVVAGTGGATAATDDKTITITDLLSVTAVESISGCDAPGSTSLVLPSWTPQSGELLLLGMAWRNKPAARTVSGNGLTWTLVAERDNDRVSAIGVALYRASGASPTAGSITIDMPGNTLPVYAAAVRLSNVDTAVNQGIEAVATASGPAAADDANMKVTVTTVTANAMALAWGGHRGSATLTVPAEETIILQSSADCGTSGDRMRGHMWRETVATPGPTVLGQDNSLGTVHPWAVIGVSIKPLAGGAPTPASLSSAANQTFTVGQAAATASTLTVTDSSTPTITATNDIRIRIPAALNMVWDTSVTSVTLGGGAAGKVSATGVTYEDSNKTAVLNVTSNFAASDVVTIAGLKFTSFTAVSSATSLQLVVAGTGGVTAATDDKTITIGAAAGIGALPVTSIADSADLSSYSFPSATYSNNVLYIAFVATTCASGAACEGVTGAPTVTSLSGAGLTFTEIGPAGGLDYAGTPGDRRIQAFHALVTSGATTGVVTATLSGQSNSMGAVILAFTGTKTTGTNGADAIANYASSASSGSVVSHQVTLPAFASSNNRPVAFFTHRANEGTNPETGYTELWDGPTSSLLMGHMAEWHATTAETTPLATWTTSSAAGGFALELAAATAAATLSSAANQTFAVGQAAATASMLAVTESSTPTITATNDIRIRIPAALNMTWDTSVTSVTLGGGAAGKVSATGVTYEDSNKTAVLNVTSNFAASDQVTIAGLKFTSFTAVSSATSLQLVVAGTGGATASTDDKTITIIAATSGTLSSASSQAFTVGQASTTASTLTVTDGSPATITATNDIRIRIPAALNMTWDTSVTSVTLGGGAAGKVSATGVTYEDSNKTAVLNVTSNFAASEAVTIAGLKFTNFTAASSATSLQLVVAGTGGATAAADDKTITINIPTSCEGAIAFDSSSSATANSNVASLTWSHTTGAGTNRVLLVSVAWRENATSVTSVKYNNIDLTKYGSTVTDWNGNVVVELWQLVAPPTGTFNVVVTRSGSARMGTGALTLTGVDQTTPIEASNTATAKSATPNASVTTVSNNAWVVDVLAFRREAAGTGNVPTGTPGAGQTERWSAYVESGGTTSDIRNKGSTKGPVTPAGAVTMSWTLSASVDWAQIAVAVKPAAQGATLSSAANQTFTVGQAAAAASTLTVTDCSTPTITAAQDLRIRIPAALNMVWDTSVTTVTLGGGAAGKVSASGVTYEDGNKTAVLNVTSNFAGSDQVTIAGLRFMNFTAASSATSLQLVVAGAGGATVATDSKTITIVAPATLSSAANQTFTVGQASTTASTLTVTDSSVATITAAQNLRIRIPAGLNMTWDTSVTSITRGGTAAGKVSATLLAYEDGDKTAVVDVTTNFSASDQLTIDGLKFANFTAASAATSLQLVVAGSGGATAATDNRTKTIVTISTLSSAANQAFTVGQASTTASTLTVTDGSSPTITSAADIRIRIPAALSMTWDTSVTTVTLGGAAAGKVSATLLAYEDGNKTAVLNVTTNFAGSDQVTVAGLKLANFTAASTANNLQLVVAGAGGATAATDDKIITIAVAGTISLSSAANQTFTVGQASTAALTLTVTDAPTPSITSTQDLRIRIPAGLNMVWDTSVLAVTLGGGAAGKVSATLLAYEDGNKTAVINVTTNFAADDQLTISGLKFTNFTAVSAASSLQLVVSGAGGATAATDDKTVAIVSVLTLSSAANQTFSIGQASTTASTLTVTESSTPTITTSNEIRIRIPATLGMTWDTSVTTITRGGTASGKVSATLAAYEDGGKTAVVNVTTNFAANDTLTIAGLKFTNFTAISAHNLQLVVAGSGGATAAIDDKTVTINLAGTVNQQTISGCVAPGTGAVSIGTIASNSANGGNSTLDVTGVNLSGQNAVVVFVGYNNDNLETVTSVVIDPGGANQTSMGAPLADIFNTRSGNDDGRIYVFGLVNPPQGTFTIRVTFSAALASSRGSNIVVYPLSGVDTAAAFRATGTAEQDGTGSVPVSSASGDLVLAGVAVEGKTGSTVAAPAVEDTDIFGGSSGTVHMLATAHQDGAAPSVTFNWTHGSDHWAAAGVSVKPAPAAPPTSLVLPSWTPQSGELLLVGVALRDETIVPSLSGNGLTWTLVADRDNDRGQMGVNLYRASGASPTAGSITISLPGNTLPAYAVAVRMSNVDTAVNQGIEAVATASGPAGADNDDMKVSVTTLTANATALAWGGQQGSATFSLPAGETMINQSSADCGSSPDQMRGHMWQEVVPTPAATQLGQDNDLSAARPWAAIAVSVKPKPPTPPQAPGRFNAFEPTTVAGAMTGVIRTKIAGNTVALDIIALNSSRTAIDTAFTGTVKVEVLNASNNTGALDGDGCRSTWTVIQTLSNPTFAAGDLGRKTISFTEANSYRDVRLRVSYPTTSPTQIGCSGDNFTIRPGMFANFAVGDNDWQTAGTSRALTSTAFEAITHKAGRPLSVRASAVNATGTTVTTNYTGTPAQWISACAGAACTASFGTLTLASTFAAGQLSTDVASYSDVGSFALQLVDSNYAGVDAYDTIGDCNASGSYVCSATVNVGRFVPNHFTVSLNTPAFGSACSSFTYIGQIFNYSTAPVITLTARNFAGGTTTLYADPAKWWRITNASLTGRAYTTATGTLDTSGITGTDPAILPMGSGVGTLTFRTPSFFAAGTGFFFPRTTPVAPFDAEISLAINVIDADGISYATNPVRFGLPSTGSGIVFSTGKAMRFGRFAIGNAYGSQLVPLAVRVEAQYWSGPPINAFLTNTLDNCTSVAPANYAMSNFTGNLSGSPTCETAISGGGTLSSGRGALILATPGAANDGSVLLTANLGATASGTTCTTLGGAPISATTANLLHLQGNWAGGAYDTNPSARASFGVYRGSDEVIHMRENF